jgi:isocitrate dehydrogenase
MINYTVINTATEKMRRDQLIHLFSYAGVSYLTTVLHIQILLAQSQKHGYNGAMNYTSTQLPPNGEKILINNATIETPNNPIIPFIEGDGIGPDIWRATKRVLDSAIKMAYQENRKIHWMEVYAGEKAYTNFNNWLPDETIESFKEFLIGIKGPLTTPVGGGIRSLNVALRRGLDLYVCQRPVRWLKGVPSPMRFPEYVDMVVFRENTEDLYAGIEFESETEENAQFQDFLETTFPDEYNKIRFPKTSGFSIKPISREGTERLVRAAIQWALDNDRSSVTLAHKGNIMKFTEGAFRNWGYALAESEFGDRVYTWTQWERTKQEKDKTAADREQELAIDEGRLLIKDVIADAAFEQTITRPKEFDVIATTNLNGDYLSDALTAQIGGVGIAPGGNINYSTGTALFEATHGTAPIFANQDKVNPSSLILSGEMMLRYMGWTEASDLIIKGIEGAVAAKTVTFDLYNQMPDAKLMQTSEFGEAIIRHMEE